MNQVSMSADDTWISFVTILEKGYRSRYSRYQRMLTGHLRFSFVKFGLLEQGHLALLAQVPRDVPNPERIGDVHEAFGRCLLWYRSFDNATGRVSAGSRKKEKSVQSHTPIRQRRTMEDLLEGVCEDCGWKMSSAGNSRSYRIESRDFREKHTPLKNTGENGIRVRIGGGTLSFTRDLIGAENVSREVSRALRLWMMRINGLLLYAKTGFTASPRRVVVLARLPLEGLTVVECREAVLSLRAAGSALSGEAVALLQPDVAHTYLAETSNPSFTERR